MPKKYVCISQLSQLISTKYSWKSQFLRKWNLWEVFQIKISHHCMHILYAYHKKKVSCIQTSILILISIFVKQLPHLNFKACLMDKCTSVNSSPYLCVQRKTRDDWQKNCPKHVEFHSKNKFEKLVRLVGFITRNLCCSLCQEARCKYHFGTWLSPISILSCRVSYLWIWIIFSVVHTIQCEMIGWWGNNQLNRI